MADDDALREELTALLAGGRAHLDAKRIFGAVPPERRGDVPPGLPHSPWDLVEHLRIAQWDIVEFSRNPRHGSPDWPEGYWPERHEPPSDAAWEQSVHQFLRDNEAMRELVSDPERDLFTPFEHGEGQSLVREALTLADHNAYHLGQLVDVLRLLNAWPPAGRNT